MQPLGVGFANRVERTPLASIREDCQRREIDTRLLRTVPGVPDVAAEVKSYTGKQTIAQGETFDASPANVDRRAVRFTTRYARPIGAGRTRFCDGPCPA